MVSSSFVLFTSWQAGLRKQPGLSEHVSEHASVIKSHDIVHPYAKQNILTTDWQYAMKILMLMKKRKNNFFVYYLHISSHLIGPFSHKLIFNIHLNFCSILPHFGVFFLWNLRTIQVFSFYHDHMFPEIPGIQSMCMIWLTSHP